MAAARLMGINVNRVITITFAVGSALAAVAGMLIGAYFDAVYPLMGWTAGIKAFTAAVLGGIGSIPRGDDRGGPHGPCGDAGGRLHLVGFS